MLKAWGRAVRPPERWKCAFKRGSATTTNIARTSLLALRESSDGFPPLKTVTAAVLSVWDIADRAKTSKKAARALASRCKDILEVIADSTPDPFNIQPEILTRINKFRIVVSEITEALVPLQKRTIGSTLLHLNRSEDELISLNQRLNNVHQDLKMACALYTVSEMTSMRKDVLSLKACVLGNVSETSSIRKDILSLDKRLCLQYATGVFFVVAA